MRGEPGNRLESMGRLQQQQEPEEERILPANRKL